MIKHCTIIHSLCLLFFNTLIFSQILTINNNASISLDPGSSIYIDGLTIAPSQTYVIGEVAGVARSQNPVTSAGNTSVDRVFSSSGLISSFSGTVSFSYLEGELNGIDEDKLVLEVQGDDDSWTSYAGTVDMPNNTISFTFLDPVSFKSITASDSGATLTVEGTSGNLRALSVYPNPTAEHIYIHTNKEFHADLFNNQGKKIISTQQSKIDIREFKNGVYMLRITTHNNQPTTFKIIKK